MMASMIKPILENNILNIVLSFKPSLISPAPPAPRQKKMLLFRVIYGCVKCKVFIYMQKME